MLLTTLAFLFIALFRMILPLSEKNHVKIFKMSFCDSQGLEKIANVSIRGRSVAFRVRLL